MSSTAGSPPDTAPDAPSVLRRSPRINEDDVFRAADELLFQGQRPTIDRVRMRLGRGSPNTINDHLDRWWAKLGSRVNGMPRGQFPELPEQVGDALQRLWNEALSAAHEVLKTTLDTREQALREQQQALDVERRELADQSQLATTRATVLEDSLQLAREQLLAANRRAEALETALAERDVELSRVRAKSDALELEWREAKAQRDLDRKAHEKVRVKLEDRHEVLEKRLVAEVDRLRDQNKDAERQRREARDALERLQRECNGLHIELSALRARMKSAGSKPPRSQPQLQPQPQMKKTRTTAEPRTKVSSAPGKAASSLATADSRNKVASAPGKATSSLAIPDPRTKVTGAPSKAASNLSIPDLGTKVVSAAGKATSNLAGAESRTKVQSALGKAASSRAGARRLKK